MRTNFNEQGARRQLTTLHALRRGLRETVYVSLAIR